MRKELTRNDIKRLRLQPGDFVLLRYPDHLHPEFLEQIGQHIAAVCGFRVGIIQEYYPGDVQRLGPETIARMRAALDEASKVCATPKPRHTK